MLTEQTELTEQTDGHYVNSNAIGRIKVPKSAEVSDLYLRCNEFVSITYQEDNTKVRLRQGGIISSNSYFSSFYEIFYTKYTSLKSFFYVLQLEGDFKVSINREFSTKNSREVIFEEEFKDCKFLEPVKTPPIDLLQNENAGRIYIEVLCLSEEGSFGQGLLLTDESKVREVNLGIIICTFKKEAYVKNTVAAILQDSLLQNKSFNVFIVDNGRTLEPEQFIHPKFTLVSNINAGGSGGFTRGLVEALDQNTYSHFLLMDDDIKLESESIYRLISLYEYATSEFAVAGALLDLNNQHMLYEAGALYNEGSKTRGFGPGALTALNYNVDLRTTKGLNHLLPKEDADYGGFWCFCFSKEIIEKSKLPLPLFIKIDDVEFGLRIRKDLKIPIVAFPAIAVWHQPASAKNLNWETYYYARNDLIAYTIHFSLGYMEVVSHFTKVIIQSLLQSNYDQAQMYIKAYEDYLQGSDFIKNSDPEVFHPNLIKLSRTYENQTAVSQLDRIKLLTRWLKIAAKGRTQWSSVSQEWKEAAPEMISTQFWRRYLRLKDSKIS
ncbi:MAG: glycosyltransferase [Timaviella obliquedivisa GSE-PSE-MK23-08B]|jgi:galactofuranosylgalactofuranosylrhamnosyl-N-acetylglucosaminyl-diphospho-decaprenol beta-1,5/1,6-galactofuranosyltransferase|nr:glycosyltransferase [Timaviella obliquedivisa GSE-PSE-MK23-08B]